MASYIRVNKWDEFQHYKDRSPPWIKLHNDLLTSRTWVSGTAEDRALAIAIMLLAARHDNKIPLDMAYIQRAAYLPSEPDLQYLYDVDFISVIGGTLADASKALADASHSPSPSVVNRKVSKSKSYKKRAKQLSEETLPDNWREYCKTKRPELNAEDVWENFRDYYLGHGKPMADWTRTWQRWVRNEKRGTRKIAETPLERIARQV